MSKVIMTCGRLCSGKTTYAEMLRKQDNAVILSLDELMLKMFPEGAGESHDRYVYRATDYLLKKASEIAAAGIEVILDWGFWTKSLRMHAHDFFKENGISCELHYLIVDNEEWQRRIKRRNSLWKPDGSAGYYVDEGLIKKFSSVFEEPDPDEVDNRVHV